MRILALAGLILLFLLFNLSMEYNHNATLASNLKKALKTTITLLTWLLCVVVAFALVFIIIFGPFWL